MDPGAVLAADPLPRRTIGRPRKIKAMRLSVRRLTACVTGLDAAAVSSIHILVRTLDPATLAASVSADEGTMRVAVTEHGVHVEYNRTVAVWPAAKRAFRFVHEALRG